MFGIVHYIKERKLFKNRKLLNNYDKMGYHRERLDASKLIWSIFSKDFEKDDEIYWLGHDNVYGFLHGEKLIADAEAVKKKKVLDFWKKIDELFF
jgi:hypothetical protein